MYTSVYIGSYDITQATGFRLTSIDYISRSNRNLELNSRLFERGSVLSRVDDGEKKITFEGTFTGESLDETMNNRANLLAQIDSEELITIQIPYVKSGQIYYRDYEGILEKEIYTERLGGHLSETLIYVVPDGHGTVNNNKSSTSSTLNDNIAEMETPVKSTYSLTGLTVDNQYTFTQTHRNYSIALSFTASDTTATIVFDHITKSVTLDDVEQTFTGEFFKVKFIDDVAYINSSGATATVSHEWDSWVR